jgi:hypothetical protein
MFLLSVFRVSPCFQFCAQVSPRSFKSSDIPKRATLRMSDSNWVYLIWGIKKAPNYLLDAYLYFFPSSSDFFLYSSKEILSF